VYDGFMSAMCTPIYGPLFPLEQQHGPHDDVFMWESYQKCCMQSYSVSKVKYQVHITSLNSRGAYARLGCFIS
jgi:hypothetical protein